MAEPLGGQRGFSQAEINRKVANMVRLGEVVALDPAAARVKVKTGGNTTTWLPWTTARAGEDRDWAAPEPFEQVLLLSPSGDLAQGVVIAGIYQADYPAPGDRPTVRRTVFKDGTIAEYDRAAHQHLLDLRACGGTAKVVTGEAETIVAPGRIELRVGGASIVITADTITMRAGRIDLNP